MAQKTHPPIRLVFRRGSLFLKCVVLTAIVLSTVALLTLRATTLEARSRTQQLRQEAVALEQANEKLTQDIDALGTIEGIRNVAAEVLGLVDPDTTFFQPGNPDISE